jgi:hypothetical protein
MSLAAIGVLVLLLVGDKGNRQICGSFLPSASAEWEDSDPPVPAPAPLTETVKPSSLAGNCLVDPIFTIPCVCDIPTLAAQAPPGKYLAFFVSVDDVRRDRATEEWRVSLVAPCYPLVGPFELPSKTVVIGYRDGLWLIDPSGLVEVVDGKVVKVRHAWQPTSGALEGGEVIIKAYVQRKRR